MLLLKVSIIRKLFKNVFINLLVIFSLNTNFSLTVTRSTAKVFRTKKFLNPRREAAKWINVRVQINVCPELESKLDLRAYRPKPTRRFSVCETSSHETIPKRRQTIDGRISDVTKSGIFALSVCREWAFKLVLTHFRYRRSMFSKITLHRFLTVGHNLKRMSILFIFFLLFLSRTIATFSRFIIWLDEWSNWTCRARW